MKKPILYIAITAIVLTGVVFSYKLLQKQDSAIATKEKLPAKYYCPMHPSYTSPVPGDCPICGMKLVPIKDAGTSKIAHTEAEMPIEGRVSISITPEKQQKIGVQFSRIGKIQIKKTINLTAVVEHDETRYAKIAPRFSGWIRKLYINYTGQNIEKGEPIMTVYSPEVVSSINEYLAAFNRFEAIKNNPSAPQYEINKNLLESAKNRLLLMEIAEQEINRIEQGKGSVNEITIYSPIKGHIINKGAIEGKYFGAGETLYEIGDLSRVWVRAYVYEKDLAFLKTGLPVIVKVPYEINKEYKSKISFIYPHINEKTRRAEVRIEVENPDIELRPAMWATAEMEINYGELLCIPASAVIDTGQRYITFVRTKEDHLEPRAIKVGLKTDEYYQVIEGVSETDEVVSHALFIVDSESQLRAAIAGMSSHNHKSEAQTDTK